MTFSTLLADSTIGVRFVLMALAIVPGVAIIVCARAIARWLERHTENKP